MECKFILVSCLFFGSVLPGFAAGEGFVIKGTIPGISDGSRIKMVAAEGGFRDSVSSAVANCGRFVLEGQVNRPLLCEIDIEAFDKDGIGKAFDLMVENLEMYVSAAHIDSVPPSFYFGSDGLRLARNMSVTGGKAQQEYAEYKETIYPYEVASKRAHFNLYIDEKRDRGEEVEKRLSAIYNMANVDKDNAEMEFIRNHPTYSISGKLLSQLLSTPFSYTLDELDGFETMTRGMWDKERLAAVDKAIAESRKSPKGMKYTDFKALDTEGKEHSLSGLLERGKYVLVDFWASWCGPCRRAIPHVRELYKKYGDKLVVCAVSMDSNEKAWRKAMEMEKMEWMQLWIDKPYLEGVTAPYGIKSIPFMLLIDPEGNIAFAGHDPYYVRDFLSRILD